MVDASVSNTDRETCTGSSPVRGTEKNQRFHTIRFLARSDACKVFYARCDGASSMFVWNFLWGNVVTLHLSLVLYHHSSEGCSWLWIVEPLLRWKNLAMAHTALLLQLLLWGTTLVRTEQMYSVFLQVLPIQKAISMYSLL